MPNIESLIIQGGIAGVFAVFVIVMTRDTLKYMGKRDDIILGITKQMSELSTNIAILTEVVATLKDCVKENNDARETSKKLESLPRTTPRGKVQRERGSDSEFTGK